MAAWITYNVLAGVVAYLCGSIPTGYWMGKLLRGIDFREHGPNSTGATNVLRTLGKGPALIALAIDLLKGVAAVTFARWLLGTPAVAASVPGSINFDNWLSWMTVIAALLAVVGHSRSIFIRFTGGKSAATGLGVLFAVSWPVGLGAALCFIAVLAISRIVSLSSISAAIAAVVLMLILNQPSAFSVLAIAGAAYVVLRHKQNIHRLIAGAEPRTGQASQN